MAGSCLGGGGTGEISLGGFFIEEFSFGGSLTVDWSFVVTLTTSTSIGGATFSCIGLSGSLPRGCLRGEVSFVQGAVFDMDMYPDVWAIELDRPETQDIITSGKKNPIYYLHTVLIHVIKQF